MNKIFNGDDIKSFRLIRPFNNKGERKQIITYTKKTDRTVFFPIVTDEKEIFNALKNLLGPYGAIKSFYRYYFPKKFVWTSVLYNKPKVIQMIDEKHKKDLVLSNLPGFRGLPRNKLMDRRNLILDQTDIMKQTFVNDPKLMIRTSVNQYVQEIIPETICYFLFKNNNHVELIEPDEGAIESMKRDIEDNSFEAKSIEDLYDRYGNSSYEEFDDTAVKMQLNDFSEESYKEYLYSKTKLTSIGGPIIGIDDYGFDKFVISIPITLKTHKYFSIPYLTGKLNLLRQVIINPDLIYQISFIRFVVKLAESYINGTSNQDQYGKEMLNKEIAFHFYSERGLGFVMNLDELKNSMKWDFNRIVRTLSNRLSLLVMHNLGTVKETDLDKLEEEEVNHNFEVTSNAINPDLTHVSYANKTLDDDLNNVLKNDAVLKVKKIAEDTNKNNKVSVVKVKDISDDDIDEVNKIFDLKKNKLSDKTEIIPSSKTINATKTQVDLLEKTFKSFATSTNKKKVIIEDKSDNSEITYTDDELDDILGETDTTEDNINDNTENKNVNDNLQELSDKEDQENNQSENPEDDLDDFTERYGDFTSTDNDNIDDEVYYNDDGDEEYTELSPNEDNTVLKTIKKEEIQKKVIPKREQKRLETLRNKYHSIEINGTKIDDIIGNANKTQIETEKTSKPIETKDPKLGSKMALSEFTKSYIKNNYQADIINTVRSLSMNKEVPMYMTDVKVEDTTDQFADKYTYTFKLEDEFKKHHQVKFDVPKLDDEGFFKMNGNKCYIKKQLIRKPIVKISPDKVYITTELNSYQIMREGMLLNKGTEVVRRLFNEYFVGNPNVLIERGNCIEDNKDYLTTIEYDLLAQSYYTIIINPPSNKNRSDYAQEVHIYFSQKKIRKIIEDNKLNTGYDKLPSNILPIAINFTTKTVYSIDVNNKGSIISTIINLLRTSLNDDNMLDFIKKVKTPKRRMCTKIDIQSKIVPLIVFLNYLFGWERVKSYFKESNINFSNKPIKGSNQLFVKFNDGYLYYNQYPIAGAILLNGLSLVNTEDYNYEDMNDTGLYLNFLDDTFGSRNIAKGWITAKECMLDLKTLQILEALNLPTDLLEIFLYCNDLLTDNFVKSESDISNYRIRSSEIISSCLYQCLIEQYNTYKKRNGKKITLSMPQNAVMSKVYETEIMEYYNCISPIGEIGAYNTTTFKGPGGTKEEKAFTMEKRAYDPSYYGTFAVSTTDNGNAGIAKRLTMNPKIENTLGFIGKQDDKDVSVSDVSCVEEALTPFVNKMDDPSRIAFVSIQNTHVGGLIDSSLPPVRTGVEKTIQYQVSETFAKKAKQDGVITDIDEVNKKIFVTYKDGTKDVIDYENQMLKNSDAYNMATYDKFVKVGQKVKENDLIAADNRFFKRDPITDEIIYTQARSAMVALMEGSYTEDDSSLITETLSRKLHMNFSKCKSIVLKPTDTIISSKQVGDYVHLGDPILVFDDTGTIELTTTIKNDSFVGLDDEDETIASMIHQTPKANLDGKIEDIRIFWTVPLEQMSETMRKFVNKYINRIKKEITEEEKYTGKRSPKRNYLEITVPNKNRVCGEEVDNKQGGVVVQFFISNDDIMSVGDKVSLHSALKSVNSTVVPKALEPYRENGRLDGIFSMISVNARMINSVYTSGFCGKILYDFSKNWAKDLLKETGDLK